MPDLQLPRKMRGSWGARVKVWGRRLELWLGWSRSLSVPVGLYHAPFFAYLILGLGSYDHKVGYLKKGVWCEPTGRVSTASASSEK